MKQNSFFLRVLLLFFTLTSCKKSFLDVPNSLLFRQTYVTDLKTTGDFLTGIYQDLSLKFCHGYNQIYPELISDNIKTVDPSSKTFVNQYQWIQLADNSGSEYAPSVESVNMNAIWFAGYRIIRSCNFVIAKADEYKVQSSNIANNFKAQALSIRAYVHFILVNIFSQSFNYTNTASHLGIPYVKNYDWEQTVFRQSVGEVYANIIADLNMAIPLFSAKETNLVMNKDAANAMLARTYLFVGNYLMAKNTSREVIANVPMMESNSGYPSKLFTNGETEALFQLSPSAAGISLPSPTGSYTGTFTTNFQGRFLASPAQFLATKDIVDLIREDPADVRNKWITLVSGNNTITKYPTNVIPGFSRPAASHYQTLLRSSEMYLIAAESYTYLNLEDSAKFYLDAIRKRASPAALPTTATGPTLSDLIQKERRKELCFEGLRMFDLLRWKKGVDRIEFWTPMAKNLPYPSDKAIAPIPVDDVELAKLEQNKGYY